MYQLDNFELLFGAMLLEGTLKKKKKIAVGKVILVREELYPQFPALE